MEPAFYLWSNTRDDGQWVSSSSNSLARFQLSDFRDRKRPLILSFVLQQRAFDARVEPGIAGYLPRFPVRLLRELYQTATWGRGTVVLPNLTDDNGVAFLINYPQVRSAENIHSSVNNLDGEPEQIEFLPILCWCTSMDTPPGMPGMPGEPQSASANERVSVVVLVSFDEVVPQKMGEFWRLPYRQDRLWSFEQWAFLDIAAAFLHWPEVWTRARLELGRRHAAMYSTTNPVIDLDTTQTIHQDMSNIIALREDLRLFIAACENMKYTMDRQFPGTGRARLAKRWPLLRATGFDEEETYRLFEEMEYRLQYIQRNHQHQQETSEVIIRQLEILLSLAFNTQAAAQGQAMASLNIMAAIFLPLSFVSSIFGMTQFDISAAWYPLGAVIVLAVMAGLMFFLRYFSVNLNMTRLLLLSSRRPNRQARPVFNLPGFGSSEEEKAVADAEQSGRTNGEGGGIFPELLQPSNQPVITGGGMPPSSQLAGGVAPAMFQGSSYGSSPWMRERINAGVGGDEFAGNAQLNTTLAGLGGLSGAGIVLAVNNSYREHKRS